jgi:hypothetical protein
MYIVGKRSDQSILFTSGRYSENPTKKSILNWASAQFGGSNSDYDVFFIDDSTNKSERIQNGDEFLLEWTLITKKEEEQDGIAKETSRWCITDIDFSPEDNKKWLSFSIDKNNIVADGNKTIDITVNVLTPDKKSIDTKVTTNILIPVQTPTREAKMRFQIASGVYTKTFSTLEYGEWTIPLDGVRFGGMRIDNQQTFSALIP